MKYFDTFTGIGGFTIAIQNVKDDAECVGYSEIDKYASSIYQRHYPNHKNYGDIKKINAEELPDFDLLVGGFPCQAFSIAGKRGGFEDTRGTLFFDLARILRTKKPRLFVFENVKGLLSHDKGNTFKTIISTLDELGYDCQWQVLNSKNFGVPQNRERVFIVGHLRGTGRPEVFPIKGQSNENTTIGKSAETAVARTLTGGGHTGGNHSGMTIIRENIIGTVRVRKYAVAIEKLKTTLRKHKNLTNKEIAEKLNKPITLVEHWFRTDTSFSIPDEDIWFQLKELLKIKTDEFDKSITEFEIRDNKFDMANRIYMKDGISPTITTLTGGHQHTAIDDGYSIRRLTPTECERLQGFPDGWTEGGLSDIMEICVNINPAIDKQLLELNTVSNITSDGKGMVVPICQKENTNYVNIVLEELLPEDGVINTINRGNAMVTLFNRKGTLQNAEELKQNLTSEKMVGKSTCKLWKIKLEGHYEKEKLSTILTWINETMMAITSISARIDKNIIGVIIHWNESEQNYSNWESLDLKMGNINTISDTQRYKTLGNAVTVNVVQAIMERLLCY